MRAVPTRDTAAEMRFRTLLRSLGVAYRTLNRDLPGSPDVANRRRRWAIFVHGCFWHAHRNCHRATVPKTNVDFWERKLSRNVDRDRRVQRALRRAGYAVLTVWECELAEPVTVIKRLNRFFDG